ncbi:hypothetical protein AVEN_52041-1 [Araneus ventricosus]|uniref:Transposable element Tc1 transposase n=1 Tax=Araneus ventricosus TaxID=182803 RepID=A0A4Y2CG85_ARAVE|nr:hypothetical protein AVEN_52041-1 [Araneus ventricosus]
MPGPANTAIGPIDDWKHVAWSDESRFQLYRADGRVRVWRKPHKSMGPTCQQGTVQSGGASVVVWSLCSWSEMEPLIRLETALTGDNRTMRHPTRQDLLLSGSRNTFLRLDTSIGHLNLQT